MKKVQLGSSDLSVSEICLGTMTWGQQNNQADADQQIEYALEKGINFIDTAEMYSIPPKAETQGATETIIGNWFQKNPSRRDELVLASKTTGNGIAWVRDGRDVTGESIKQAVDGSLKRLQTSYIDLYQIHWPNRTSPHFGKHWPGTIDYSQMDVEAERAGMLDILRGLDECVKAGKIRYCGLSNETPWGISEYLRLGEENNLPRMVSIQNEFNLLHLTDSPHIIENCVLNNVAYLPWSPLAAGILSGKYRNGSIPEGSRWSMTQRKGLFRNIPSVHEAVEAFYGVAQKHGMTLSQMSLAWVYQFSGVSSTIIGATSMEQLKEDIDAFELTLSEELLSDINAVIRNHPVPF